MIYTLFSPSEGKRPDGCDTPLDEHSLLFGLSSRRMILDTYNTLLSKDDPDEALALFGLKKAADASAYLHDIYSAPTMKALYRYSGVAYEYLDAPSLDTDSVKFLNDSLIIFSNLFGPLLARDEIPNYKVKQGNAIGEITPERYYKAAFNDDLDALIGENEILDLRAGYYHKFYKPTRPVTTMKFIKDGKVVSHWAKAYRGIVVRHLAQQRFESINALLASDISGLRIKEIQKKSARQEVIFDILT